MGAKGFINTCVAVVVIIIFIRIYQLLTFGAPKKPSINNLPIEKVTSTAWNVFSHLITTVFWWILVGITFIWIFWHFLKAISPATLGITGLIVKVVPPFPQLKRAGIFRLWDDVVKNLIRFNLFGVIRGFLRFFRTSAKFIAETFVRKRTHKARAQITTNRQGDTPPPEPAPAVVQEDYKGNADTEKDKELTEKEQEEADAYNTANREEKQLENEDATDDSMYSPEEHKAVQAKMAMCMAENTEHQDEDAPVKDRLQKDVNNRTAYTTCKAKTVGEYGGIRKGKYKKPRRK